MGRRWTPCENGWYMAHPEQRGIDAAQEYAGAQTTGVYEQGAERIFLGRLSEVGFSHFLAERFVPFTMNGGLDVLPDFVIGGDHTGVSLKCRSLQKGRFRANYVVNVPTDDIDREQDEQFFFCCYEYPINRLLLLGGLSRAEFRSMATRVPAGAELNPVTRAGEATYSVQTHRLHPPMEWLWMLYGSKVRTA